MIYDILKVRKMKITRFGFSWFGRSQQLGMRGLLLFCFGFFSVAGLSAQPQNDPKAEAILKKVSAVYQSYSTIKASFTLTTTPVSGRASVEKGSVWLKGKKFRLDYGSQEIYCNSIFTWTYSTEDAEVTKENFKLRDNSITPNEIFTIYNKGFKSKYEGPIVRNGKNYDVIQLVPKNAANYSYLKLEIDKLTNKIQRVIQHYKNGTEVAIEVTSMTPNTALADTFFDWNTATHADVTLVDLTKKRKP
jgi:outer membrane lipoprotein-sorting protein